MRIKFLALLGAASTLMAGCASTTTPNYDRHFGEAVRTARAQQTLNPDASRNTDPVTGLNGAAAREAIGRYQDSFKAPPQTFEVMGIGGGLTSK